jgi:hypothetical protein
MGQNGQLALLFGLRVDRECDVIGEIGEGRRQALR